MTLGGFLGVMAALGFVLALLALTLKLLRKFSPTLGARARLPMEVVQRLALSPRQGIAVVRIGERLVAVSVGEGGVRQVAELGSADQLPVLGAAEPRVLGAAEPRVIGGAARRVLGSLRARTRPAVEARLSERVAVRAPRAVADAALRGDFLLAGELARGAKPSAVSQSRIMTMKTMPTPASAGRMPFGAALRIAAGNALRGAMVLTLSLGALRAAGAQAPAATAPAVAPIVRQAPRQVPALPAARTPQAAPSAPSARPAAAPTLPAAPPATPVQSAGGAPRAESAAGAQSGAAGARADQMIARIAPQIDMRMGGAAPGEGLRLSGTVGVVVMMGLLTLLPTLLLMMTGFTRILIVLNFLKQALGTQSAPPAHLVAGLALLLTGFVMAPTLSEVNRTALEPWMDGRMEQTEMMKVGVKPFREFMLRQTRDADIVAFVEMARAEPPKTADDIPLVVLVSAFVTSELRTAFQIGFALFLPFIVIDVVVSSVLMSMGMMMLPPAMIALPFKLLLFVLVDGWTLVIQGLVQSFK